MCLALLTDKNLAPARACGGRYAWFCRATWMGEALAPNTKQGVLSHAGRAGPNSSRQGSLQSRQRRHTYGPRVAPEKRRWTGTTRCRWLFWSSSRQADGPSKGQGEHPDSDPPEKGSAFTAPRTADCSAPRLGGDVCEGRGQAPTWKPRRGHTLAHDSFHGPRAAVRPSDSAAASQSGRAAGRRTIFGPPRAPHATHSQGSGQDTAATQSARSHRLRCLHEQPCAKAAGARPGRRSVGWWHHHQPRTTLAAQTRSTASQQH